MCYLCEDPHLSLYALSGQFKKIQFCMNELDLINFTGLKSGHWVVLFTLSISAGFILSCHHSWGWGALKCFQRSESWLHLTTFTVSTFNALVSLCGPDILHQRQPIKALPFPFPFSHSPPDLPLIPLFYVLRHLLRPCYWRVGECNGL